MLTNHNPPERRYLDYRHCTECDWQFTPQTPDATLCPLCSNSIERHKRNMAARPKEQRKYALPVTPPRPCEHCGDLFQPKQGRHGANQRYCKGDACIKERRNIARAKERALYKSRARPEEDVECAECHTVFQTSDSRIVTCSDACLHERKLRQQRGYRQRKAQAERDKLAAMMQAAERKRAA